MRGRGGCGEPRSRGSGGACESSFPGCLQRAPGLPSPLRRKPGRCPRQPSAVGGRTDLRRRGRRSKRAVPSPGPGGRRGLCDSSRALPGTEGGRGGDAVCPRPAGWACCPSGGPGLAGERRRGAPRSLTKGGAKSCP